MKKLVITFSALALALAGEAAIRAVTPTPWNGKPDCWQMKRHNEKLALAKAGGAPVVFIGDSITHFWETKNGNKVWAKYFEKGKYRALNLGTSADRTEHVLWRLQNGELDGYEAKCILLMIGTNNTGHFPVEQEPPVDTILGVKEILSVIAAKQPNARTILTAIFPRATATSEGRRRNAVINKELAKFADGKRVIWCDFTDKYLAADGTLSVELFPDLLHPNERGYEIWASSVIPLVDKVLAAAPDECIPSVWPSLPTGYVQGRTLAAEPSSGFPSFCYWGSRCLAKRNEIVDNAANGTNEYDIVMVGDSITHRWERKGGEGVQLFAELKKTYRILNLGYGGDRTQHVNWRLANGELEGYKAKLFTLMIGTNNQEREPKQIAAGVREILKLIKAKHPEAKVVLMPIFPSGDSPKFANRIRNYKVNEIIRGYADGKVVRWLDFNDKFLDEKGDTKALMNDRLHPNEKGYQVWLDAMLPVVKEICGK